jgi:hypothetical protein
LKFSPRFDLDGAELFPAALNGVEVGAVAELFGEAGAAGRRLDAVAVAPVTHLLRATGAIGRLAIELVGEAARPIRAIAFDKSANANWRLGWHQDRVIPVRERVEVPGFSAWSVKSGQLHVQPPVETISRMATLRVHVDAVDDENAPLRFLVGSHKLGRLTDAHIAALARDGVKARCLAQPGDVWAYSTPVVHSSAEQRRSGRRRVLQVDYSADDLPGGLEWVPLV